MTEGEGEEDGDVENSRTTEIHTGSLQLLMVLKALMERICTYITQEERHKNEQYILIHGSPTSAYTFIIHHPISSCTIY